MRVRGCVCVCVCFPVCETVRDDSFERKKQPVMLYDCVWIICSAPEHPQTLAQSCKRHRYIGEA